MKKSLPFSKIFIVLFIALVIFTFLVQIDFLTGIDLFFTSLLQSLIPRTFDLPFSLFSLSGSFEIALLIIFILWAINRKLNLFIVLISFTAFQVIEVFGKLFINHPSPPASLSRYEIPFSFPSSSFSTGSSYPSGHVGRTAFISVLLFFFLYKSNKLTQVQKNIIYLLIFGFDITMYISRIYLGEHWLSDVVGGAFLGSILGFLPLILF